MRRYVVVGNQTLLSSRLLRELRTCLAVEPCSFHVLVPASNPHVHAFWTEGEAHAVACDRLTEALDRLAAEGIAATGSIGDANPTDAVCDLLRREPFDAVIVSMLPPGLSRWIHHDLPRRLEQRVALPVRRVVTPFEDLRPARGRALQDAMH